MSWINIMIWRMVEILQHFLNCWGPWGKAFEFETESKSKRWEKDLGSSFQRNAGFHDIKQRNLKVTIGIPFIFSSYRGSPDLSSSPHHI